MTTPLFTVDRGATVVWPISFIDSNGVLVVPTTVMLYVSYKHNGLRTTVTPAITPTGSTFTASWLSTPADPGRVDWHVRSINPEIANEGSFTVNANAANPATP